MSLKRSLGLNAAEESPYLDLVTLLFGKLTRVSLRLIYFCSLLFDSEATSL